MQGSSQTLYNNFVTFWYNLQLRTQYLDSNARLENNARFDHVRTDLNADKYTFLTQTNLNISLNWKTGRAYQIGPALSGFHRRKNLLKRMSRY
jgi:hypothetical protein